MKIDLFLFNDMLESVANADEFDKLSWEDRLYEEYNTNMDLSKIKVEYHINLMKDSGFVTDFGLTWAGNKYTLDLIKSKFREKVMRAKK